MIFIFQIILDFWDFVVKVFTADDCETYLGRNVIRKGFQPIQVSINNYSTHHIYFLPEKMSLSVYPAAKVASRVHFSTVRPFVVYLFSLTF